METIVEADRVPVHVETPSAITEEWMLRTGLTFVGFPPSRQKVRTIQNLSRFKAFYGVGPKALVALHNDLLEEGIGSLDAKDFFMAISWLRLYDTEHVMAGRWGLSEEIIRNRVKRHTLAIQALKEKKIFYDDNLFGDDEVFRR